MSAATDSGLSLTPSMMALARRVSGMVAGAIVSPCASHSAAIACANAKVGAARTRPAGVRTGLPSSCTAYPSAPAAGAGAALR
jgi:hypothetical protein